MRSFIYLCFSGGLKATAFHYESARFMISFLSLFDSIKLPNEIENRNQFPFECNIKVIKNANQ